MRACVLAVLAFAASASAQTDLARALLHVTVAGDSLYCVPIAPGTQRQSAPSLGTVQLLNVRIRFADDAALPVSPDLEQQEAWFAAESYGRMTLVTAEASVELSRTRAAYAAGGDTYAFGAWVDELHERLAVLGVDQSAFDIVSYQARYLPPLDLGPNALARGELGGRLIWTPFGGKVLAHEIGHTLGLHHADARGVVAGNPLAGPPVEYGNRHDVMGRGGLEDGMGSLYKQYLGWLGDEGVRYLTEAGTYRVWATNGPVPGDAEHPVALGLPDLAFRLETRTTADGGLLLVQRSASTSSARTIQIDASPETTGTYDSLLLLPGERFDFLSFVGRTVAPLVRPLASGVDARGHWVDVEVLLDNAPPTVGPDASVDGRTYSLGETVPFDVDVADPDGDIASVVYESRGRRLTSSSSPPFAAGWNPSAVGTYSVRARATDDRAAETVSPPFAVRVTDGSPPASDPIGAYGLISLPEGTAPGTWTRVVLGHAFEAPVVLVSANTLRRAEPTAVSLRDVATEGEATSFWVRVDPWADASPPRTLSFLAVEAGTHRLPSGPLVQAGHLAVESGQWTTHPLDVAFTIGSSDAPVVFAGSLDADRSASPRIDTSAPGGVHLRLPTPEGTPAPSTPQRVAFVAIAQALEPDPVASGRLETGRVQTRDGSADVDLQQGYGTVGPRPVFAALQQDTGTAPAVIWASAPSPYALRLTVVSPDPAAEAGVTPVGYASFGPVEPPDVPAAGGEARATSVLLRGTRGAPPSEPEVPPGLAVSVVPNPSARGQGRVRVTTDTSGPLRITLTDVLGRRIASLADRSVESASVDVPLPASLAPGVYVVLVQSGDATTSVPVTVLR